MPQTYKCPNCDYEVQLEAHEAAEVGTPICSECDVQCELIDIAPLLQLFAELGLSDDALDDLVHESKAGEASTINNGGASAQLDYLVEAWGATDLRAKLLEIAGGC